MSKRRKAGVSGRAAFLPRLLGSVPRRVAVLLSAVALLAVPLWPSAAVAVGAGTGAGQPDDGMAWQGGWAASVQPPIDGLVPSWSTEGFDQQTVRQVVRVSKGGSDARFELSNRYGTSALKVAGATVARTERGASVREGTVRPLTFGGETSVTVPVGQELFSDPAGMRVGALEPLTVTLYLAEPTGPATYHMAASATSYRAFGDHRADEGGEAFTETSVSWYYLSDVEVRREETEPLDGVVAFGDSITDGFNSALDGDNRYPDQLAERFADAGRPRSILNQGISGNMITTGTQGTGESGVDRFAEDVLAEPAVRTVIVMEGINDIGLGGRGNIPDVSVAQLIDAHRDLIAQARAAGLKVIGSTLLPFEGAPYFTERGEVKRDALNEWIRTSGAYDEVIDLDSVIADPADPDRMTPAYDSGDHLHPSDAGYQAMARAIDLGAL